MKKKILVIGGGASGMVAAIFAARNGANVTIIEQQSEVGKKILATGNGRCNYTNSDMNASHYYCDDMEFINKLLSNYKTQDILEFFNSIGILSKNRNGYIYPLTDQAASIRDALLEELNNCKVSIYTDTIAERIIYPNPLDVNSTYFIQTNHENFTCDALIISTGGKSGLTKYNTKHGYALLDQTNHSISTLSPALVPLLGEGEFYKKIAGIRTDATVAAKIDGKIIRCESGELQLTDYGISGIPIFQISRILTQALKRCSKSELEVEIDFMPMYTQEQLSKLFNERKKLFVNRSMHSFMNGILKDKLNSFFLYTGRISEEQLVETVSEEQFNKLIKIIKTFSVKINGSKDFRQSQVTAGGVPLNQLTDTLESIYHKNMYFTGEVLNADGICGGYNLHFAWATGMLVGNQCMKS